MGSARVLFGHIVFLQTLPPLFIYGEDKCRTGVNGERIEMKIFQCTHLMSDARRFKFNEEKINFLNLRKYSDLIDLSILKPEKQ